MTLEDAIGPIGAAHLRGFASAAAKAFPTLVEQVGLLREVSEGARRTDEARRPLPHRGLEDAQRSAAI